MATNLPPAGSPAADVLIEALSQYVSNQDEALEDYEEADRDPKEVERLRIARLILEKLEKEFLAAVGV